MITFDFRTLMLIVMILLVAEDFQYLLKIESSVLAQSEMQDLCEGCENDGEGKEEKSEEKKEENKEKDENKEPSPEYLTFTYSRYAKNIFRDAPRLPVHIAYEMETPPPEI